jgi:cytochrome-b5 reductase
MLQVIEDSLSNSADSTKFTLLFGNISSKDVLLKEHLDSLQKSNPERFRIVYTIDKPEKNWNWEVGYIDAEKIRRYLPKPAKDSFIYVCGPPAQVASVAGPKAKDYTQGELAGELQKLGYQKENVFKF